MRVPRTARTARTRGTSVSLQARIRAARDVTSAVAALYLLVALLVGFAHHPIGLAQDAPAIEQALLPDGSVSVICNTNPSSDDPLHHAAAALCDACLISAAPGLAVKPPEVAPPVFATLAVAPRPRTELCTGLLRSAVRARGPPSSMTMA